MKKWLFLFALCSFSASILAQKPIRVACVGNSVTYGYGIANRDHNSYPAQLSRLLGSDYDVRNFGRSSATLLSKGRLPYVSLPEYREAVKFRPDIAVIHLGLNDTDPSAWPNYADEFIPDYRALIDSFRVANPQCQIAVCLLTPIFTGHRRFDSSTRDWHRLVTARISQIAETADVDLIDLYTPLHCHPDLFPDALHPDSAGAAILAETVRGYVTGNYGGLRLPATFSDGMVIQRHRPIDIHGIANAGDEVNISLGKVRVKATTTTDGRWQATLPEMPAGGPYTLTVKTKTEKITLQDIWIGEVWLCSGQSNMAFTLAECATATEDIAAADTLTRVHLYHLTPVASPSNPQWDAATLDAVTQLGYMQTARWEKASASTAKDFSAIGFHVGRLLADSLGCHVGIICNAVGGSPLESWIDRTTLETHLPAIYQRWTETDYSMDWVRQRAKEQMRQATSPRQRHPFEPSYLYEAAIKPLEGYPVAGVVWYQGESNAHNAELHTRLFHYFLESWRATWAKPDLPFYTIQLSSIGNRPTWPHFRDSQRRLAENTPGVFLTVSHDLGDSLDVHPKQKREVAQRVTSAILNHTYGRTDISPSGPAFKGFEIEGASLRLTFDYAWGLHAADGDLRGFEVAGEDGFWHTATAVIDGCQILVSSAEVPHPVAVRYGWQPFTRANLVGLTGLPASTFRSERGGIY